MSTGYNHSDLTSDEFLSWGRYPRVSQQVLAVEWLFELPDFNQGGSYLPRGLGRSYGDACLNADNYLLTTERLDKIISFDQSSGLLRCEAGLTLAQILEFAIPRGFFLPVTPGTKFVTVGGAIANDVHGKNHHRAGTFGCHVKCFELMRSDGTRLVCSGSANSALYRATIGGLGLTGLMLWAEIQLKPISSAMIATEHIAFHDLDQFFELSAQSDQTHEYTVAWIDCVAAGGDFGRGIIIRGDHAAPESAKLGLRAPKSKALVPFDFPAFVLNRYSIKAFNALFYWLNSRKHGTKVLHYDPFFYPLDAVLGWNRIYGRRGFLQFQCVVPENGSNRAIREILSTIVESGSASFLAVLKRFGTPASPGMLSFPRPGITLCLDFAFRGQKTLDLFKRLDHMVCEFGGAIYPAKDACMAPASFRRYFPNSDEFEAHIDPRFSSSFWRRVKAA